MECIKKFLFTALFFFTTNILQAQENVEYEQIYLEKINSNISVPISWDMEVVEDNAAFVAFINYCDECAFSPNIIVGVETHDISLKDFAQNYAKSLPELEPTVKLIELEPNKLRKDSYKIKYSISSQEYNVVFLYHVFKSGNEFISVISACLEKDFDKYESLFIHVANSVKKHNSTTPE